MPISGVGSCPKLAGSFQPSRSSCFDAIKADGGSCARVGKFELSVSRRDLLEECPIKQVGGFLNLIGLTRNCTGHGEAEGVVSKPLRRDQNRRWWSSGEGDFPNALVAGILQDVNPIAYYFGIYRLFESGHEPCDTRMEVGFSEFDEVQIQ